MTVIFISPSILLVFFCPCKSTHFLIFAALISPSSIVIMIIRTCTYCTDSGSRKAVGNDRLTSGARANTADRHLILVSDRSSFKQRRIPLGRAANLFHWASAARWPEKLQLVRGLPLSNHSLRRLAAAAAYCCFLSPSWLRFVLLHTLNFRVLTTFLQRTRKIES